MRSVLVVAVVVVCILSMVHSFRHIMSCAPIVGSAPAPLPSEFHTADYDPVAGEWYTPTAVLGYADTEDSPIYTKKECMP